MKKKTFKNGVWYLGDCLDVMKELPDNSVDMILCDLPYGTTACSWDNRIPFDKLWEQYNRLLRKNKSIVLFGNNPFTALMISSNVKQYKQALVWNKNKCGSPGLAKYRHMQTHEDVVIFSNGTSLYNPQMVEGEAYSRNMNASKTNNHKIGYRDKKYNFKSNGKRYPKSILNISRDFSAQQQIHPTQKPVPLFEYLIKTYTNEGMTVLDNCAGSGTTAIACENTNRRWICIEKDLTYSNLAIKRIKENA